MGAASRRLFRIEEARAAQNPETVALDRHREILDAIRVLGQRMALAAAPAAATMAKAPQDDTAREMLELYKSELNEARRMKKELEGIRQAIDRTKQEIASLHQSNLAGGAMHRVSDELDAVVSGTEGATNIILEAAEIIDEKSRNLSAKLQGDDQGMASDIQDQVMRVFEACNFQDLTGQRISKVVKVLQFIDERVGEMIDIWGGELNFADVKPTVAEEAFDEEAGLLNGPALPDDDGRATQDMINALFD